LGLVYFDRFFDRDTQNISSFFGAGRMNNSLAAAVGIVFTLSICLYVAYALVWPWFRARRISEETAKHADEKRTTRTQGTASAHII
jgi:hypothetical protein